MFRLQNQNQNQEQRQTQNVNLNIESINEYMNQVESKHNHDNILKKEEHEMKNHAYDDSVVFGAPMTNTVEDAIRCFPLAVENPDEKSGGNKRQHDVQPDSSFVSRVINPSQNEIVNDNISRADLNKKVCQTNIENIQNLNYSINNVAQKISTIQQTEQITKLNQKSIFNKNTEWCQPNESGVQMKHPYVLFPYQLQAVQWMSNIEQGLLQYPHKSPQINGGLLCMDTGLGKTTCAANLIVKNMPHPMEQNRCTLYITTKNLLGTVKYEIHKFMGQKIKNIIYHKDFLKSLYDSFTVERLNSYDLIITNYETIIARLRTYEQALKKPENQRTRNERCAIAFFLNSWYRIILDECHEIRNKKTKRYQSCAKLLSSRKFGMSATMIFTGLKDLVSQLEFVGFNSSILPKKLNREVLKQYDVMKMALVIEEKDANVNIPEKTVKNVFFQLTANERQTYDFFLSKAREVKKEIEFGDTSKSKYLNLYMSLLCNICTAGSLLLNSKEEVLHRELWPQGFGQWLLEYGESNITSSKMMKFINLVTGIFENDINSKIVVFAQHAETLEVAIKSFQHHFSSLKDCFEHIHGGIVSSQKRDEMYSNFRSMDSKKILFTTIKLSCVGLNLTEANNVIFLERCYSYQTHFQCESRVHRIGQTRLVNIYYLVAENTAEERIKSLLEERKQTCEGAFNPYEEKNLKDDDFLFLLRD